MNGPRRPRRWVLAGLAVIASTSIVATIAAPSVYRALPILAPDSVTYLEWNPGRTPAYPLALSVMQSLTPSLAGVGWLQYAALLGAAASLAWGVYALYGSALASLALFAGVVLHPQIVSYAFTVLPESLFMTVLMVHLTLMLRSARSDNRWWLSGVSASLAVLILLKPSAYALLGCLPLLVLHKRPSRQTLFYIGAPVLLVLLAVSTANLAVRGFFAPQAQGGYSLIAHVAPFVESAAGEDDGVADRIAADVAPHRRALDGIDSLELYYLFSSHDYHAGERIVRKHIVEAFERRHGLTVTDQRQFPSDPEVLQELTAVGSDLARRAIAYNTSAYARHVAAQTFGLWMLPLIQPPAAVDRLQQSLSEIALAQRLPRPDVAFRRVPAPVFYAVRAMLGTAFVAGLAALLFFVARPSVTMWLAPAYAGLAVHANFLLVAAVQPGLPRYALVMWPAVCLILLTTACAVWSRAR